MTLENLLILSAALFSIGIYGVLSNRNFISIIMSLELIFNSLVIAGVAFSRFILPFGILDEGDIHSSTLRSALSGHMFGIFIIAVAATEAALALALVFALSRVNKNLNIENVSEIRE
ncbi:MAG: NADH-quinone oxidoreductase subunit NuoK [Chloroflexi bacterium]|nr:NADH-quinone oxidoreductase subunit NuoK [Chloroflexota bacterium]MBL01124.1 NADH-quinone oxidoreductase subunit NuoK [Chloroflexota bacterium]|tara:strand:+ start:5383 stop:5733 length:351 start_codon:yes stop_codon:yes gene_type:complete